MELDSDSIASWIPPDEFSELPSVPPNTNESDWKSHYPSVGAKYIHAKKAIQ